MKKENKKEEKAFRKELTAYIDLGVCLYLSGHPSTPSKIIKAHRIAEEPGYMRDYVTDDSGKLVSLNFLKITNR